MTFSFDKSFKQAMESTSKTFDKQSIVILLHQSKDYPGPNCKTVQSLIKTIN